MCFWTQWDPAYPLACAAFGQQTSGPSTPLLPLMAPLLLSQNTLATGAASARSRLHCASKPAAQELLLRLRGLTCTPRSAALRHSPRLLGASPQAVGARRRLFALLVGSLSMRKGLLGAGGWHGMGAAKRRRQSWTRARSLACSLSIDLALARSLSLALALSSSLCISPALYCSLSLSLAPSRTFAIF